jgi:asparagine synthase (glutamine-hydrolysing)
MGSYVCGITGLISAKSPRPDPQPIELMTLALRHRGPDAGAVWSDPEAGIALGHRRLAILDLSERGAQPMHSACGRYVVTFNGEIYNHLALREELDESGIVHWRGTSDTETLLACFAVWGVETTLKKAVGMFAFGLWDRAERRLTLARDRFGEKPLYYGWVGHGARATFVFGSELKALRAHHRFDNAIDRDAVALFLRFSYVPTPYSIYKNIFKLEPGSILTLDSVGIERRACVTESYWRYEDAVFAGLANPIRDEREGLEKLEHALREAVAGQLMADVPLGAFLSGGVDSSSIVALMQAQSSRPVKTFTVGFDETGFDEAPFAAAVARHLGTDHQEIRVSPTETLAVIPNLATTYDEPFADSSQIPTCVICAIARQSVTVALSGDAGDELLGGYNRYLLGPQLGSALGWTPGRFRRMVGAGLLSVPIERWNRLAHASFLGRRFSLLGDKVHKLAARLETLETVGDLYNSMVTQWGPVEVPALSTVCLPTKLDTLRVEHRIPEAAHRMMLLDGVTYLPEDILTKVDRAAMAASLETRVPMLDHRVAEVAWRLPLSMKIRRGRSKWALRQILYRRVPAELIERPKAGFDIPVGQWLRGPLREWAEALLAEDRVRDEGFLDPARVRALWREHLTQKRDWTDRLWNVIMFQAWLATQSNETQLAQRDSEQLSEVF